MQQKIREHIKLLFKVKVQEIGQRVNRISKQRGMNGEEKWTLNDKY